MRRRALVGGLAAAALLSGCATPGRAPQAEARSVAGRLSVQVAATPQQAARSVNADFDLQGGAERGELQLATPMGTVLAQARWRPGEVWLKSSDGERRFPTLSALADEVLGEPLPLDALFDWLRGRPWTGAPSRPLSAPEQGFEQLGWSVDLQRWNEGLVTARRGAAPAVTVKAKLTS